MIIKKFIQTVLFGFVACLPIQTVAFLEPLSTNPILSYTTSNTFDKYRVSNPKVIKDATGYKLYYSGLGESNKIQIGLAVSDDGETWIRNDSQPNFKCGENQLDDCQNNLNWSSYRVGVVDALYKNGTYYLWYIGNSVNSGSNNFLGFATSLDGVNWTANDNNPVFPDFNSNVIEFQSVVSKNNVFYLYYRLNDDLGTYLATSEDGVSWVEQNNGQPVNPGYLLSVGIYNNKFYGFINGSLYLSSDGQSFTKADIDRIAEDGVPQVEGTLLIGDNDVQLWNTKGVGFEFGGFFNTVINYYKGPSESIKKLFSEEAEIGLSLNQLRVDGKTIVPQAGTVIGNGLVFEAVLEDGAVPKSRALEVEVKPVTESFDGIETFTSAFTEETTISTKVKDFIKASDLYGGKNRGDFKWRARVVEEGGDVSDWVEFGDDGTDFTLRAVPLMTQQVSPYPSIADTTAWAGKPYGFGRSPECKNTIKGCGCALSALTTLARYHGVVKGIDGSDVNPDNLNEWLKQNNGYDAADNIKFHQVMKYFGKQNNGATETRFKIREHNATNPNVIRTFVTNHGPTVANALPTGFTHFFVLDSVLDTGYELSDPFWYGTDTSNDSKNLALSVQDYDDTINSARLIEVDETPSRVARGFEVHLASPATLLITDNQGRRLGFDPRSGVSYTEIPTGEYWHEADIATEDAFGPVHETKIAAILNPEASPYTIEVIGESTGEYALSILTSEDGGTSTMRNFASTTSAGAVHRYTASYEGDQLSLDLQRISGFIAWLKAKLPTLPNGVQKAATVFIARYEPQVYAGSMVLTENQRSILAQWEGQKNLTSGLDLVQRIIKSFE